ncbi:uncharacterized protein CC84DRAFT_1081733 [Paraphaeosphaeria sporulosa]|uniref:F-box domain-containing protein n=1 Tax=Paraphaeosphaeria sporulosa TaxID=1460663 RepID=A0A177CSJ3_9PLEO|nr:uncharacterized protein CC84DRAFT_1081733 [Paraphaeosphaeria sporulosa]OAG09902.1 hypothetical protein CC84DRAFT_1081733 [Paraphaeosphaeria sporulosa]
MDLDSFREHGEHGKSKEQTSPFLQLPNDLFRCVMDYLDRESAWSLKRVCKGMSTSKAIDELLYRYPLQLNDVKDIRLGDWNYRPMGQARWNGLKSSINDKNRHHVQKLALSHWCSIGDFKWIEQNLPSLTSLDLSAIKDFVWTPEETWTWKALSEACPKLFARLEELEVSNWADYTAHSRIEYSYAYNDYRFKQQFRLSRRRDGGSVAKMIFPLCKKLKTLAIRERYSGFHTWNEWEVHQRVCCLIDGIKNYCPPTLTKLRVHDYAPYRSLFSTDASTWSNIKVVEIGLYSWMEDRRDRDVIGPIPYRITQGHHHREEEEAFDDKTYDDCKRNHMDLGNNVVQGAGASFEDLLKSLRNITRKYPSVTIKPIDTLRDITLHPFHLVNVNQRRLHGNAQQHIQQQPDPVANVEIQEALQWLAEKCGWRPILAWDSMMCDVFPANLEPSRSFLPKEEVLSRIKAMISTLRSLDIPIRISIGDRTNSCPSSGLDGNLYFGDYKMFIGEGENKRELLAPTQAGFNLAGIAHMVDELTIQYAGDVPGVHGWLRQTRTPTNAEKVLIDRELLGWRRFWERYARLFTNLKKLTTNVPIGIYNDWGQCEGLRELLGDERWEMLEVEEKGGDFGFHGSYFPFTSLRYSHLRRRTRLKFVQRVFFRQDAKPLHLKPKHPQLEDKEREALEITDADIETPDGLAEHCFWPAEQEELKGKAVGEKRSASDVDGEDGNTEAEGPATKKAKSD